MPKPSLSQLIELTDNPTGGADLAVGQHQMWLSEDDAAQLLLLLVQHRERRYRRLQRLQARAAGADLDATNGGE